MSGTDVCVSWEEGRGYENECVETSGSGAVVSGDVVAVSAGSRLSWRELWCRGSSCGGPLCRGYGVGGRCVSICWVEDMVSGEAMMSRAVVWRSTVSRLAGAIVR